MPMRITCPNCGKQFSAWDDLVGKAVECPKCHQKTVIAGPNAALGSAAPAAPPPPGRPTTSNKPASPPPKVRVASAPPSKSAAPVPKPPAASAAAPTPVAKPAATAGPRPAAATRFDDDDSLPNGCPNCNATMQPNDDLCDSCGYHLVLKKVIDISEMPKRNQTTGFDRIFQSQLDDPESSGNTMLWAKIVGTMLFVGLLVLCLGFRWWWVGVIVAAGIGGALWWMQQQHTKKGSTGSQDPLFGIAWRTFLGVQRVIGWRRMQWPFPKTRMLIFCDPNFDDRDLKDLQNLSEVETLDLEGTGITDAAAEHLKTLKHLRYLVVRRTQMTLPAAQRLQFELRKTMIWI